jgi:Bacterial Ig domain
MQSLRVCLVMAALTLATALSVLPTQVASAAPSTTVVLPSNGATLSGITQYLDATASSGVTQVQYELTGGSLNDHVIATATPTYVGWAAAWNTTTVANGTYTLNSVASYPGEVTATSPPITITVDNAPPSTTVVFPASGATVSTTQTQFYDAVASAGVTAVQIELTGAAETSTLDATPTIYGWIASIPGYTCVPPPEGGCADASFPETVQSVASYSNGLTGTSPPVSITIVAEIPIGV